MSELNWRERISFYNYATWLFFSILGSVKNTAKSLLAILFVCFAALVIGFRNGVNEIWPLIRNEWRAKLFFRDAYSEQLNDLNRDEHEGAGI